MSEDFKDCEYCEFSIPRTAEVCGHCGRDVAYEVTETTVDKSLMARWRQSQVEGFQGALILAFVGYFWPGGEDGAILLGLIGYLLGLVSGLISGKKTVTRKWVRNGG